MRFFTLAERHTEDTPSTSALQHETSLRSSLTLSPLHRYYNLARWYMEELQRKRDAGEPNVER